MDMQLLEKAYGSYEIPDVIYRLLQVEKELEKEGLRMGAIGLNPVTDYFHYSITPPDVIPFAHTGGDGIHFGFLTEFGQAAHLDEAPIVCVTPTNNPPIRLLARNIRDFLDMATSVRYVEDLEIWWQSKEEGIMYALERERDKDILSEWITEQQQVKRRVQAEFGTKPCDFYSYIQAYKEERARTTAIHTLDGIGVIGVKGDFQPYPMRIGQPLDEQELSRMRAYLSAAAREEKLPLFGM